MTKASHLIIAVSNGRNSKTFYDNLFKRLKWKTIFEDKESAGYSDGSFSLWIVPANKQGKHTFHAPGFHHFSFQVDRKIDVDKFYTWCKENEIEVVDPPREYPEYSPGYYALFFLDPDGMKLEITFIP